MTGRQISLKKIARTTLLATMLGATSLAAVPVQAAGSSHSGSAQFGFSFNSGDGFRFSFGNGDFFDRKYGQRDTRKWGKNRRHRACLTNRQLYRMLRHHGFRQVQVLKVRKGVLVAKVNKRWRTYIVRMDRCDGDILSVRKVRRGWR